ncbi:hypothetical protein N7478_009164 [Penicillium angulare]|uniref:uncharacterized protein n=1 Tax=Penicillium angulare TaxID=116970 RepID=UPI00254065DE|nr:uncharacterized protein N7478_009164 [Penicillium angulare]KAJ5274039.1 hypothetical protein N7478_009164 [Penicillium angulare]
MRVRIRDFAVLELCRAAGNQNIRLVEDLLASGVDPNARFDDLESVLSGVEEGWASGEKNALPPRFYEDESEEPPLYGATRRGGRDKTCITRLMKALLKHGADPYALFRQPIILHQEQPLFPGSSVDLEEVSDETLDLDYGFFARRGIIDEARKSEFERLSLDPNSDPNAIFDSYEFVGSPFGNNDMGDWIDYEDRFPHPYGVRSVLHSLLEMGVFVQPILDFLGDQIDVERRDPQGRTLFLAACLSRLGLDGAVDGIYTTVSDARSDKGMAENPFPQPDNAWRSFERPSTTRSIGPSLLDFFISHGSNLLAVDNYGRNAFHLIFDEEKHVTDLPSINDIAIKYLVKSCPSLVNKPDKAGFYPLHMAIRWMGIGGHSGWTPVYAPESLYQVEVPVNELLSAGADPLVRDSRGNTVLHYLAASKLGEKNHRVGHKQKRLLQVFLDRGVDPKTRNADGRTALELFFTTGNDDQVHHDQLDDQEGYRILCEEVLGIFVKGGYDIEERNEEGQTLLHLVGTLASERAAAWFKVLQARGLDPLAEDKEGNTPLGLAKKNDELERFMVNDRIE